MQRLRLAAVPLNHRPDVILEGLLDLFGELVRNYDLDGLHYDYIRYPREIREVAEGYEDRAKKLGNWSYDPVSLARFSKETGIAAEKLEKIKGYWAETPFSLDRPVNDEDGRKFIDFLEEENVPTPYEQLVSRKWSDEVRRLLDTLTPMEARILRWRFGLDDEDELTLKEIGDKYNLSRERIRQLQEQALDSLRLLTTSTRLRTDQLRRETEDTWDKVKTLKKYLGKDFNIAATVGHLKDLPEKEMGIDVDNGFKPKYRSIPGKQRVIKDLKRSAGNTAEVFLAPDPDREGEAIAWHTADVLKKKGRNFYRVLFHEIGHMIHYLNIDENLDPFNQYIGEIG